MDGVEKARKTGAYSGSGVRRKGLISDRVEVYNGRTISGLHLYIPQVLVILLLLYMIRPIGLGNAMLKHGDL
jgi:hypothetical protein